MGRGIALQFKRAFPENFKAYAAACKRKEVRPGRMFVFETSQLTKPRYIINFPTKRHWRGKSRMEDIEAGLEALAEEIGRANIVNRHSSDRERPRRSEVGRGATADRGGSRAKRRARVVIFEPSGPPEMAG